MLKMGEYLKLHTPPYACQSNDISLMYLSEFYYKLFLTLLYFEYLEIVFLLMGV